jgi:penicillin-binding protein 1A
MCLGTPDISPLELTAAYATFANKGVGYAPTAIKRLFSTKNPADFKIYKPEQYQVISPEAAYMTARILQSVITQGTAVATVGKWASEAKEKGRKIPEIGAKTGTTNDCMVAWLCGFTPDVALGVFVGYDQHRSMGSKMTGGNTVGPIWSAMMDRILLSKNDWKMKFDVPDGIEFRDICGLSGKLAGGACGSSVYSNAAFKKGTAPESGCTVHGGGFVGTDESGDPESMYNMGANQGGYQQQRYQQQQYQQQNYNWPGY